MIRARIAAWLKRREQSAFVLLPSAEGPSPDPKLGRELEATVKRITGKSVRTTGDIWSDTHE